MLQIAEAYDAKFKDDLPAFIAHLKTTPEYEPTSPEALLIHYRDITSRISPALLKLFHVKTLPSTPFEIVRPSTLSIYIYLRPAPFCARQTP
jgi:uncharacterized protein (DUF885 family)